MNGPEHYVEADKLLAYVNEGAMREGVSLSRLDIVEITGRAQVHATLAHAAATALASIDRMPDEDYAAWDKVAGVPTRSEDE